MDIVVYNSMVILSELHIKTTHIHKMTAMHSFHADHYLLTQTFTGHATKQFEYQLLRYIFK